MRGSSATTLAAVAECLWELESKNHADKYISIFINQL